MANPTTNFGWVMPTATDLVTDLPADFDVFGQAVDTSLAQLKGGTTGQVLSKTSNTNMAFTWITPQVGDITAVTAGTGISGGGTGGDVTITNSMATAIDAKGDLIAGTGSDAFSRLAVGTNGQVLTADSTAATGLAWASAAAGSWTTLASGSLSGSSLSLTSISQSYKNLRLIVKDFYGSSSSAPFIRLNGDSTADAYYDSGTQYVTSAAAIGEKGTNWGVVWSTMSTSQNFNSVVFDLYDYTNTTAYKLMRSTTVQWVSGSGTGVSNLSGAWKNTAAVNAIAFTIGSGTYSGGTYILYGQN